jgi:hypothetical protein
MRKADNLTTFMCRLSRNLGASTSWKAVPWLRRLAAGLPLRRHGFNPGQSMWGLWWTKWHWDRFFSELSVFPCQFHSTGAPLFVKLGKKNCSSSSQGCAKSLRLWCVRSICCGALQHVKKNLLEP